MNPTIAQADHAHIVTRSWVDESRSLLDTIVEKLKSALEDHSRQTAPPHRPQTFIEANLLDPEMGPEISRCLQR